MSKHARLLQPGDEGKLDTFLSPHTPFVYFMRSNAIKSGMRYEGKPYQSDFFGFFHDDQLTGVLSHSWLGNVQVFIPEIENIDVLVAEWRRYRHIHPREIIGFLGGARYVKAFMAATSLTLSMLRGGERYDDLFALQLDKMNVIARPDTKVRRAEPKDSKLLITWRHDFNVEAIGMPAGQKTYDNGRDEINRRIAEGDLFVLEYQEELVSFCGVGGFLSDWKSVGPVWTPIDKRNLGYARLVTSGALSIVHQEGAQHAVLFTDVPQAAKAYRALGFERIGDWRLDFLIQPVYVL